MKRFLIVVLVVLCVLSLAACRETKNDVENTVPDNAAEDIEESVTGDVANEDILPSDYITYIGEITEVSHEDGYKIRVVQKDVPGGEDMYVNITDETVIADENTELKEGDKVCVVTSAETTRSSPAIANGKYIVRADDGSPNYIKVGKVEQGDDGSVLVTNEAEDLVVTLLKDMPIEAYPAGETKSISDIKKGDEIFAWYEMVTLSLPAQATAEKTLIISK